MRESHAILKGFRSFPQDILILSKFFFVCFLDHGSDTLAIATTDNTSKGNAPTTYKLSVTLVRMTMYKLTTNIHRRHENRYVKYFEEQHDSDKHHLFCTSDQGRYA